MPFEKLGTCEKTETCSHNETAFQMGIQQRFRKETPLPILSVAVPFVIVHIRMSVTDKIYWLSGNLKSSF